MSVEPPVEMLLPFDIAEYRKEPHRLRSATGKKPLKSAEFTEFNDLCVVWDYPKNLAWKAKQYYSLDDPKALETSLRLASPLIEVRDRYWLDSTGIVRLWSTIQLGQITQKQIASSTVFAEWLSEEVVRVLPKGKIAVEGSPTGCNLPAMGQSEMLKVPRGAEFYYWRSALAAHPDCKVWTRHMLWFFQCDVDVLGSRIQKGELPAPVGTTRQRRWLLADVAKHTDKFLGAAKDSLEVATLQSIADQSKI